MSTAAAHRDTVLADDPGIRTQSDAPLMSPSDPERPPSNDHDFRKCVRGLTADRDMARRAYLQAEGQAREKKLKYVQAQTKLDAFLNYETESHPLLERMEKGRRG